MRFTEHQTAYLNEIVNLIDKYKHTHSDMNLVTEEDDNTWYLDSLREQIKHILQMGTYSSWQADYINAYQIPYRKLKQLVG